jgi:hypothetical protein
MPNPMSLFLLQGKLPVQERVFRKSLLTNIRIFIEALKANSAYSNFLSLVLSSPAVLKLLTTADGYTLFAPTSIFLLLV